MGGTMALHLSTLYEFERVIALTPQYSVLPDEIPEEDRWFHFRKKIKTFHFPRVEGLRPDATRYFILHGDERRELAHANRFPNAPGIAHFIVPNADHRLADHLKRRKVLAPLMHAVISGQAKRFRQEIRVIDAVSMCSFKPPQSLQAVALPITAA